MAKQNKIEIITISSGDKADELRQRIVDLINEYSDILTGYQLAGIIEAIREDCHHAIQNSTEEEE